MNTYHQPPANDQSPDGGRRAGTRWFLGAGAILLAVGVLGGVALAGNTSSPASPANSAAPAGPAGQAAVLSAVLGSAGSGQAGTAQAATAQAAAAGPAGYPAARRCALVIRRLRAIGRQHAARAVRRHCRRVIRRRIGLRLLGGMYGQFTFRTRSGIRTIGYERGIVASDSGSSLVVRAADGTTETWNLTGRTVVRRDGARTSRSALAGGEPVFVAGQVVSGAHDIRLAVIRPAAAAAPANSPAGS